MMARPRGAPSAGRQRIEIRRIADDSRRQVTFSKRRAGIFKKLDEIATLCGAAIAAIVFSPNGRAYGFGSPSTDHVLRRHLPVPDAAPVLDDGMAVPDREGATALHDALEDTKAMIHAEQTRMDAIGAKVSQAMAGKQFWWELDVDALGEAELAELIKALQKLQINVVRRLSALPPQPQRV